MKTGEHVGNDRGERLIDTGQCPTAVCGNHVYVLESQYERLRETGQLFYCPAGHGQSFTARKVLHERERRLKAAEREASEAKAAAERARHAADLKARTCPWPTCEGRVLASERGLRQHMVKAHGAPWATPELSADAAGQVLNGRDPAEVVS